MEAKRWSIEVLIDEHQNSTRATATLRSPERTNVVGTGLARLNPTDVNVPEIGDELAAARALSDMAHKLIELTAEDIEAVTHQPARLSG